MNRNLAAATVAPVALVAGGWWFGVWQHRQDQVADLQQQTAVLNADMASRQAMLHAAERYVAEGDKSAAHLESLRAALPASADIGGFIAANEAAATATGVVISSLAPDPLELKSAPAPPGLVSTGIDLTVTGAPAQVTRYLDELTTLPRAVVIDTFSSTGEGTTRASLTLRIRIFHRDPSR